MNDPLTIRMEKDLRKQIEKEAKKQKRSLSSQIVMILENYFKKGN